MVVDKDVSFNPKTVRLAKNAYLCFKWKPNKLWKEFKVINDRIQWKIDLRSIFVEMKAEIKKHNFKV